VTRVRLSRIFWIGAAAILVAAALVALVAVLRGDFSDTDGRILGTLAAALFAGSTLLAGLALVERGGRLLGWAAVAVAPLSFAVLVYSIWSFVFDGEDDAWRWGWVGILALLAALMALTARLLARSVPLVRLAALAGVLAGIASAVSVAAIWSDDPGDTFGRAIAVLWILAGLAYLLVPVLQRFSAAATTAAEERVVVALGDVELVATRSGTGVAVELAPGERVLLRRRSGD
jgi:hypothetical protein